MNSLCNLHEDCAKELLFRQKVNGQDLSPDCSLAMGTIEQRIDQVLEEKRELFHSVFSPESKPAKPGSRSAGLSREGIFSLFNLKFPAA